MRELSLHILDLVENSITASAYRIDIEVIKDFTLDFMSISIIDDGEGIKKKNNSSY